MREVGLLRRWGGEDMILYYEEGRMSMNKMEWAEI
jgi:hypothetical protein